MDTPETRQARARYLAAVANADRDLGLVYDAARKHLGDDTLFLFTGDHGSQFPFGKWNCYDAGVRTPLIVAWPGRVKPGSTVGRAGELDRPAADVPGGGRRQGRRRGSSGRSFLGVLRGREGRRTATRCSSPTAATAT